MITLSLPQLSLSTDFVGFTLQWRDGSHWRDLLPAVAHNTSPAWSATFIPVRTQAARLIVTATPDHISRIWEVEFYGVVAGASP